MLLPLLEKIGLNEKEREVYQALLELGRTNAASISKVTKIPRATVYGIVDKLYRDGIINVESTRGSTYYLPSPPDALQRLIEKKRKELQEKEKAITQLTDIIGPLIQSSGFVYPKIRMAEGKENITNMFYDTFKSFREAAKRDGDNNVYGFQDAAFVDIFRGFLDWRWRTASENIYFFSNLSSTEQKLAGQVPGRHIRPLPGKMEFTSSIYVFGKHHVMIVSTREKPLRAILVTEPHIAANLQAIFRLIWELTEEKRSSEKQR